jgi:hypothetical protein
MAKNLRATSPPPRKTRKPASTVPYPRSPDSAFQSVRNEDRAPRPERDAPLLSARGLLILTISLLVGTLSGTVAGLMAAAQAVAALGKTAGIGLGIAAGTASLVVTGLAAATSLHKLLR